MVPRLEIKDGRYVFKEEERDYEGESYPGETRGYIETLKSNIHTVPASRGPPIAGHTLVGIIVCSGL